MVASDRQTWKVALVCRLWRDLSEEFIYKHLLARNIDTLSTLKILVTLPAYTRIHTISANDRNRRRRGIWARSFTFKDFSQIPISALGAQTLRVERAIIELLAHLPNLQLFSLQGVDTPTGQISRRLLQHLPTTITDISCTEGQSDVSFSHLPQRLKDKLRFFALGGSMYDPGGGHNINISSPSLQCLSIDTRVLVTSSWTLPKLHVLIIIRRAEFMDLSWILAVQAVGNNILRLEMINNRSSKWDINPQDLRWCTRLHTIVFDLLRCTVIYKVLGDTSLKHASIKRLILIVRQDDNASRRLGEVFTLMRDLSAWVKGCFSDSLEIILSLPLGHLLIDNSAFRTLKESIAWRNFCIIYY